MLEASDLFPDDVEYLKILDCCVLAFLAPCDTFGVILHTWVNV